MSAAPAPPAAPALSLGTPAASSLTAQLVSRRQQRAGATALLAQASAAQALGALPAPAPLALPAPAPAPAQAGGPEAAAPPSPIEVDQEETAEPVDWSGSGLALPVAYAPVGATGGPAVKAFGKVLPASRSARGAPYGSSEIADAMATAQAAEQLLASSPEPLATTEPPGGVEVKLECASA
jgi:hypothetical protein